MPSILLLPALCKKMSWITSLVSCPASPMSSVPVKFHPLLVFEPGSRYIIALPNALS